MKQNRSNKNLTICCDVISLCLQKETLRISRRSCNERLRSETCFNKLELANIREYGVEALSNMYWHCEMYSLFSEKHLRVLSACARSAESLEL
jgi:hypothetical protein